MNSNAWGTAVAMALLSTGSAVPAAADAAPKAVISVIARGAKTPSAVRLSWWRQADPAHAGVRIVVVPGARPTTDPSDAAAVFTANMATPASNLIWSTGAPGAQYSVSAFAYDAAGTSFAAPATTRVALPGGVRHLSFTRPDTLQYAVFANGRYADGALYCHRTDRVPASPAEAEGCEKQREDSSAMYVPQGFSAVFSIDSKTGVLGPGVTAGDGQLPVRRPIEPFDESVNPSTLDFTWQHNGIKYGDVGPGANVRWELRWAPGARTPVGNPAAQKVDIPVAGAKNIGDSFRNRYSYRVTRLVPDAPYTFAIRGVDADGDVSEWALRTAATSVSGIYLVDNANPKGVWRSSPVPWVQNNAALELALEPGGTAHVAGLSNKPWEPEGYQVRAPGRPWRQDPLPTDLHRLPPNPTDEQLMLAEQTQLSASRTSSEYALTDGWCVHVRGAAGWRRAGCLREYVSPEDERLNGYPVEVLGLEVDKRGAVHAVFEEEAESGARSLHYASNASGKWLLRPISVSGYGRRASTHLTYDPAADRLVLVVGNSVADTDADDRYQLRVTSKSANAPTFDPFSTRYDARESRAVVPTSVASYGGRITIAAVRHNRSGSGDDWGSPVLLTGTSAATVGGMTAVPGAGGADYSILVVAQSRDRVLVGWSNENFGDAQGIWTAWRTFPAGGAPSFSVPQRLTRSASDQLADMAVDAGGHPHLLFERG